MKLIEIKGNSDKTIELCEGELHRILLMAKDLRRVTGRPSKREYEET